MKRTYKEDYHIDIGRDTVYVDTTLDWYKCSGHRFYKTYEEGVEDSRKRYGDDIQISETNRDDIHRSYTVYRNMPKGSREPWEHLEGFCVTINIIEEYAKNPALVTYDTSITNVLSEAYKNYGKGIRCIVIDKDKGLYGIVKDNKYVEFFFILAE